MDIVITDNQQQQQFQATLNGEQAYLEYRWYKQALALMHTFVPESLEGKGIASALAKFALEYAKANKIQVMVYCPFVATYLKRHPEYNFLVIKNGGDS
ncbi:GNAT family N-acetyltransferase [Flavihumibacter fluvii]|uniref:GNAT family N-acetyltransferase n=1 Tax=Flavihumibacter fluvii TaxID=2838157 RepID=UPI001BDF405A|nr:GNAT family N-acetyltransferase [Flavihumibacter fluvii]ULQ51305.1 N-acetyltransferase [Flavihumibacter fluvii]